MMERVEADPQQKEDEFTSGLMDAGDAELHLHGFTATTPHAEVVDEIARGAKSAATLFKVSEELRSLPLRKIADISQDGIQFALESLETKKGLLGSPLVTYFQARITIAQVKQETRHGLVYRSVIQDCLNKMEEVATLLGWAELRVDTIAVRTDPEIDLTSRSYTALMRRRLEGTPTLPKLLWQIVTDLPRNITHKGTPLTEINRHLPLLRENALIVGPTPPKLPKKLRPKDVSDLEVALEEVDREQGIYVYDLNDQENLVTYGHLVVMAEAITRILHQDKVHKVGPSHEDMLSPDTFGVPNEAYVDILAFREKNREIIVDLNQMAEDVLLKKELLPRRTTQARNFMAEVSMLIDKYELMEVQVGFLKSATQGLLTVYVAELRKYEAWLASLIAEFPPDTMSSTTLGDLFRGEPVEADESGWKKFFESTIESPNALTVAQLRQRYVRALADEMFRLNVNKLFVDSPNKAKFDELISHLRIVRKTPEALKLADFIETRIHLFDAMNPIGMTGAMVGDVPKIGKEARSNGFDTPIIQFYWALDPENSFRYEHADILLKMNALQEDLYFEDPDPDLFVVNGSERTDADAASVWGPTFDIPATRNRAGYTVDVPVDMIGMPKGKSVKGRFSFFTNIWSAEKIKLRNEMTERIQAELQPEFIAKGVVDSQEQMDVLRIGIDMSATLNIRGALFAICYAVGMSPPGGIGEYVNYLKECYPLTLEMNDAARNVRIIPSVFMGLGIPEQFLAQMEHLYKQANRYKGQRAVDAAIGPDSRMHKLRRSIRLSVLMRKRWAIPGRGVVHVMDITGEPIDHHELEANEWGLQNKLPGQRTRDALIMLPFLYADMYTFFQGRRGKNFAIEGNSLASYEAGRVAHVEFEEHVNHPMNFTGTKEELIFQIVAHVEKVFTDVSQLKKGGLAASNPMEVGEMFFKCLFMGIRYFSLKKKFDPRQESPLVRKVDSENPSILDHLTVFFTNREDQSLITALRTMIEETSYIEYGWPTDPDGNSKLFPHPNPSHVGEMLDLKTLLLTYLVRASEDPETFSFMEQYFIYQPVTAMQLRLGINQQLRLAEHDYPSWSRGMDREDPLIKVELDSEAKGMREGEDKAKATH